MAGDPEGELNKDAPIKVPSLGDRGVSCEIHFDPSRVVMDNCLRHLYERARKAIETEDTTLATRATKN